MTRSRLFLFLLSFLGLLSQPFSVRGQSFGQGILKTKRTVTLHRKLPARVHMKEGTISVKVVSRDPKNLSAVQKTVDILQTELLKNNNQLKVDDTRPDTLILCNITDILMPGVKIVSRNETVPVKVGNKTTMKQQTRRYQEVTGSMEISYEVKEMHPVKVLDADNLTAKYNQEFDAGGNNTDTDKQKLTGLFSTKTLTTNPFKKKTAEEKGDETAPTAPQLQEILIKRIVQQVAARLTNTDENVDIRLARGPALDQYNDFAEKGLWNRMLEPLETMKPLDTKEDDAFRLYNIGVGYEALAYQAENVNAAKKYLDESAVNYGKAVDANPAQKDFLDAQNRIATAQAHYSRIGATQTASSKSPASSSVYRSESNSSASSKSNADAKTAADALTNA